ncbi:MAG: hypothetical protein MJD61_05170 [Proteobacteria bacterium]|nr:hypothetical protein [Pseudomonadota bacterium]
MAAALKRDRWLPSPDQEVAHGPGHRVCRVLIPACTSLLAMGVVLAGCGGSSAPPAHAASTARSSAAASQQPRQLQSHNEINPLAPAADHVQVLFGLLPPMPVAVTSFGAASDGQHVYVLGGYAGVPHRYSREGQSRSLWRVAFGTTAALGKTALDGGRHWEEISRLAAGGVQSAALVAHAGRICAFGGLRIHNRRGDPTHMASLNESTCFDPQRGRWNRLPPLPAARSSHGAALLGHDVYLAGGWRLSGGPREARWHDALLALDLARPGATWREIPAPFKCRALGVAAAAGRIVAIGGITPERRLSREVHVFDPQTGAWGQGPEFPGKAFGLSAYGIGDRVYASARGGTLYAWRVGTARWRPAGKLAFPRFFHQLVPGSEGELLAIGGISGMHTSGRTRHVERLPVDSAVPSDGGSADARKLDETEASRGLEPGHFWSWSMDYPGVAKNRQAIFVKGDFVYFVGGNNTLEQHAFEPSNFVAQGWRLHLPSLRWQRVADYPHARQSMRTNAGSDHAVVMGGFGHDGSAAVSHADAYAFDFKTERWSRRPGLPRGRTQFGIAEHGERTWIFGGLNYDPARKGMQAFDHVTSILSAPTDQASEPFVTQRVRMPGPRRAFAAATLNGRYYIIGGMREGFQLVGDCLVFDFAQQRFAPLSCPSRPRLSGHLLALRERLYLIGGSVRDGRSMRAAKSVQVYDPAAKRWQTLIDKLPFNTRHMAALPYRDKILMLSTHQPEARLLVALWHPS